MAFLKESENWSRERIDVYQFEQTKNLLEHSMKNVPYYRRLFSEIGFRPGKMQSLDDFRMLPYLSKEIVRDSTDEFVDERVAPRSVIKNSTSGSTGIPMTIYINRENASAFLAFRLSIVGRIGYTPKSREVMFWPMIELGRRKNLPIARFGNKLVLSIRHLTGKWLFEYLKIIREFAPEYIVGCPSVLSILSSYIKNNDLPPFKNLKALIYFAETLYDWQRKLVEDAFGVRFFSFYSMTERLTIGGECEYSTDLHIHPLYGLVELVDTVQGYNEIVATGFTNYAMPFIRYKTGDVVVKGEEFCQRCGRSHQLVNKIEGRVNDFLINKEGDIIPRLMLRIKMFPNTIQYQFFQEEPGKAFLKIVRAKTYSDADTNYIRSQLAEMLGPVKDTITIEILFVDDIEKTSAGKTLLVVQKMDLRKFLNF